jgi:nicotinate-nucleotide pyrophosphorylase (carboxylating)
VQAAKATFHKIDPKLEVRILLDTGAHVASGAHILSVKGHAASILQAERIALNFMQRLSGIATQTAHYVNAVRDTSAQVLDTRKTVPGYRTLEKIAVLAGGGENHRHGLYDRAMLKDNHLATFSDNQTLQQDIDRLHQEQPDIKIQIEADSLEQVSSYLKLRNVDYLLLDNMSPTLLRQAVNMRGDRSRPLLEASGGVNLSTIQEIAQTGVDYISVGAITHSSPALDIGLDYQAEDH